MRFFFAPFPIFMSSDKLTAKNASLDELRQQIKLLTQERKKLIIAAGALANDKSKSEKSARKREIKKNIAKAQAEMKEIHRLRREISKHYKTTNAVAIVENDLPVFNEVEGKVALARLVAKHGKTVAKGAGKVAKVVGKAALKAMQVAKDVRMLVTALESLNLYAVKKKKKFLLDKAKFWSKFKKLPSADKIRSTLYSLFSNDKPFDVNSDIASSELFKSIVKLLGDGIYKVSNGKASTEYLSAAILKLIERESLLEKSTSVIKIPGTYSTYIPAVAVALMRYARKTPADAKKMTPLDTVAMAAFCSPDNASLQQFGSSRTRQAIQSTIQMDVQQMVNYFAQEVVGSVFMINVNHPLASIPVFKATSMHSSYNEMVQKKIDESPHPLRVVPALPLDAQQQTPSLVARFSRQGLTGEQISDIKMETLKQSMVELEETERSFTQQLNDKVFTLDHRMIDSNVLATCSGLNVLF